MNEAVKDNNEIIKIPELSNGFVLDEKLQGTALINIKTADRASCPEPLRRSFCYADGTRIPLYFRLKVPHGGNYGVHLVMGDSEHETCVTVFSERKRRRCVLLKAIAAFERRMESWALWKRVYVRHLLNMLTRENAFNL